MAILLYLSICISVILAYSPEEQNQELKQTNRALKQALEQLEFTSNNELSVGDDEVSVADDEVSVGWLSCPSKDIWDHGWMKSSNAGCEEWWENRKWGAGRDCSHCRNNAKMATNCPRTCCQKCRGSCKCDQSSTCTTTDPDQNFCYLDGGMMGKYCQDAVRSQVNPKKYWSWRPCKKQPCTRTSKYGDKTCEKDGFIYLVGDLAAMHCPGAIRDTTMTNTYKSYKLCEKSDCKCTTEYDGKFCAADGTCVEEINCATDGKCFLDGGSAAKSCPGAVKHPRGEFYYSKEVCKFKGGTKLLGAWHLERQISRPTSGPKTYTVKTTQSSTRSKETSSEDLSGWAKELSKTNSVEVAVEVSADFGFVSGSLSSKFNHETNKKRSSNFQQTVKDLATEAFSTSTSEEVTVQIAPREDETEPSHSNVWLWKVQAFGETQGEGEVSAIQTNIHWTMEMHGCGNDIPPNCIPGYCQSWDPNCWECTQSWAKINPDFRYPGYCNGSCWWEEVEKCPSTRECARLDGCTQQMKVGELCRANVPILPNGDKAFVRNCHRRYSVFEYKCDDFTAQSLP